MINIDITSPIDFCRKLDVYSNPSKINKIVEDNYEYYKEVCSENTFKNNYEKILNEFSYLLNRWK